jgi:hypothetical protein
MEPNVSKTNDFLIEAKIKVGTNMETENKLKTTTLLEKRRKATK